MSSQEWHQWTGNALRPHSDQPRYTGRPEAPRRLPEATLKELFIQVERKTFAVALKENVRGRFLRITEEANNRFNSLIVPEAGMEDLLTVLVEMVETSKKIPQSNPPPTSDAG